MIVYIWSNYFNKDVGNGCDYLHRIHIHVLYWYSNMYELEYKNYFQSGCAEECSIIIFIDSMIVESHSVNYFTTFQIHKQLYIVLKNNQNLFFF